MRKVTACMALAVCLLAGTASAQELEYVFSPEGSELTDPFPVGIHNGARGLSGPFDLDGDGNVEILVTQHSGGGGRVHVIENSGVDAWELVYSTPVLDSTDYDRNARYATGADLDGDGLGEIVFVAGVGYSGTDATLTEGAYVFEYDGQGSDNYGDYPAAIGNFYEIDPILGENSGNTYAQKLQAVDVDGDGQQELLVPANGPSTHDVFYVLSVTGEFETAGASGSFVAWNIESRINPRDDATIWGGGSPSDMLAADLDGDGTYEISYHSWNAFNFFNGDVTGENTVVLADANTPNPFLHATATDDVALFGGVVVDIDGDGTDEVFYPDFQTGDVGVLDYDSGDEVLSVGEDNFQVAVIPGGGGLAATAGDTDGDGHMEVIVGGSGYAAGAYRDGEPSEFIRITEFNGGDPTDPASYSSVVHLDTSDPIDTTGFNIVYRDSAGVTSRYFETARSKQGVIGSDEGDGVFPSGIALLGDADGDGSVEIALSFQGVDDSLQVIDEVYNAGTNLYDRTIREAFPAPARPFVRIYELAADFAVSTEDRPSVPTGFALSPNYPNPFNPTTTFSFTLPREEVVSVRVYDVTGRIVATLVDGVAMGVGTHRVTWNAAAGAGASLSSGTYFYSVEAGSYRAVRPMVLIK